jgi:hypothetical protein
MKKTLLSEELRRMHKLAGLIKENQEPSPEEIALLKQQALKIAQSDELQNVIKNALSKISDKEKAELFSKLKSAHIVNEQEISEGNISEMNNVMSFDNILNKVLSISGEPLEESEIGKKIAQAILATAGAVIAAPNVINAIFGGMPAVMIAQKLELITIHSGAYITPDLLKSFGASILLAGLGQSIMNLAGKINTDSLEQRKKEDESHRDKITDYYKKFTNKNDSNSEEFKFNKPF